MNNNYHEQKVSIPTEALAKFSPERVVERKIGKATFIVSSRFNDGKEKDIVSTLTRLIQNDTNNMTR